MTPDEWGAAQTRRTDWLIDQLAEKAVIMVMVRRQQERFEEIRLALEANRDSMLGLAFKTLMDILDRPY